MKVLKMELQHGAVYAKVKRPHGTATVRALPESHNGTYYTKFPQYLNLDITNQLLSED